MAFELGVHKLSDIGFKAYQCGVLGKVNNYFHNYSCPFLASIVTEMSAKPVPKECRSC